MINYVIDAYAWIEYLIGSESGAKVHIILETESREIFTCAVTVAEVISKVALSTIIIFSPCKPVKIVVSKPSMGRINGAFLKSIK